ncbi:MAG: hypothetical protein AAGJ52_10100, partial [Pseudomonadota bacterium]
MAFEPSQGQVIFRSDATNLTADPQAMARVIHLFISDQAGDPQAIRRISQGVSEPANGDTLSADVYQSASGTFVVFASEANNLVTLDSNAFSDIFVVADDGTQTRRLSTNEFGNAANGHSRQPVVSANGRHVLFESRASNLDTGSGLARPYFDLFVLDRDGDGNAVFDDAGTLRPRRIIQVTPTGLAPSAAFAGFDLSADGRYVVFSSALQGLTGDVLNAEFNVYFHDRDSDADGLFDEPMAVTTTLLSRGAGGEGLSTNSLRPVISDNGQRVVFETDAPQWQGDCVDAMPCQLFILDLPQAVGTVQPANAVVSFGLAGLVPRLSGSGQVLAYRQASRGQLFVRNIDTTSGNSRAICQSQTLRAGNRGCRFAIPDDSLSAAFESSSSNLVPLDANARSDVFVSIQGGLPPSGPPLAACQDQVDNDGNNLIDREDPGCYGPEDATEAPGGVERSVPVASAPMRTGSFSVVDARGRPGRQPDFVRSDSALRHVAYVRDSFDENRLPIELSVRSTLSPTLFNSLGLTGSDRQEGDQPFALAIDPNGILHTAFSEERNSQEPIRVRHGTADLADAVTLTLDQGCEAGVLFDLVLDSTNMARLPLWRQDCTDSLAVWRPGTGLSAVPLGLGIRELWAMKSVINFQDELLVALLENAEAPQTDQLRLVRLANNDSLISQAVFDVDTGAFGPVDFELTKDTYGLGHAAYTQAERRDEQGRAIQNSLLVYLVETGSGWNRHELRIPGSGEPKDFYVEIRFAADGFTPQFLLTPTESDLDDQQLRQFVFDAGSFREVSAPSVFGRPLDLALFQSSDGSVEYAYEDGESDNLIHADPDAPSWESQPVVAFDNQDLRDLERLERGGFDSPLPRLLTFASEFPAGAGDLVVQSPDPQTGQWSSQVILGAFPQDPVDLASDGRSLAQFVNATQTLRYVVEEAPNVWSQETVVTLAGFDTMTHVAVDVIGQEPVIYAVVRSGDGKSGDTLTAYVRDRSSQQWQAYPWLTNPVSIIAGADSDENYTAFLDDQMGGLYFARFDVVNRSWAGGLVDADAAPINIGQVLSVKVTAELLDRAYSGPIPTIAYRSLDRNRLKYASRAYHWRIWSLDDAIPTGVTIDAIDHQLLNDSRLRPLIFSRLSNGEVRVHRRTGGAARDDAPDILFERDVVGQSQSSGSAGQGLLRAGLNRKPYVVYRQPLGELAYTVGNQATGLPTARPEQR